MPSIIHQWLLVWAARKMQQDGYVLSAFEGPAPQAGWWNELPRPPLIGAFRPDALGQHPETGLVALAEAKTCEDLTSAHSRAQIATFGGSFVPALGRRCRLYVAVPSSAMQALDKVLSGMGLLNNRDSIIRLHIPDILLEETFHAPSRATAGLPPASAGGHPISA